MNRLNHSWVSIHSLCWRYEDWVYEHICLFLESPGPLTVLNSVTSFIEMVWLSASNVLQKKEIQVSKVSWKSGKCAMIADIIFIETAPAYLRPFALLSFVSEFGGTRRDLRYYIEWKWKQKRDKLIQQCMNDFLEWALCVNDVIKRISGEDRQYQFGISRQTDITVVQFCAS